MRRLYDGVPGLRARHTGPTLGIMRRPLASQSTTPTHRQTGKDGPSSPGPCGYPENLMIASSIVAARPCTSRTSSRGNGSGCPLGTHRVYIRSRAGSGASTVACCRFSSKPSAGRNRADDRARNTTTNSVGSGLPTAISMLATSVLSNASSFVWRCCANSGHMVKIGHRAADLRSRHVSLAPLAHSGPE